MAAQRLQRSALPAVALARQRVEPFRHLGPADRVGSEHDAVFLAALAEEPVQPDDDFHVLANGVGAEAANRDQRIAPEQPERAGDDQQSVHHRLRDAARQKRPEVLGDLEAGQRARRQADADDAAVLDAAAVRDADDPAGGDRGRILEERQHRPRQRVFLEQRVGVDDADERMPGGVDAGVDRVGLSAVGLVDHQQLAVQ